MRSLSAPSNQQPGSKSVIGGALSHMGGVHSFPSRLSSDGSPDPQFNVSLHVGAPSLGPQLSAVSSCPATTRRCLIAAVIAVLATSNIAAATRLAAAERAPLAIGAVAHQAYLKASNTGSGDAFGRSLAISEDTVVIGADGEDSSATGIDGDQGNNNLAGSGAAYVIVRSGTTWMQQAYLKASNTGVNDQFGFSVAVSGDTLVIGAPGEDSNATGVDGDQNNNDASGSGAAYVFVRNGSTWTQQAYLKASNTALFDFFGSAVAISGDTLVVTADFEDGSSTGINGDQTERFAASSGAAYVFVRNGVTWSQQAYIKASNTGEGDRFGVSVAASANTIVVGAIAEGSSATGVDGNQADNSAFRAGAAYVFERNNQIWAQQGYLKASNTQRDDNFGGAVSVSGDTLVVGAVGEQSNATGVNGNQADNSLNASGAAYVFLRSGSTWAQQAYLKASNTGQSDLFGSAVAVAGDSITVSAVLEDSNATGVGGNQSDNSASAAGAAYLFNRAGVSWTPTAYLKASTTDSGDQFGSAVAMTLDTVMVGASREASNATGINGNQSDNSAPVAGAVHPFAAPVSLFADGFE